jgi:exopolyphosphatase/guanosine-5'-triphosphate,3'-diphosphate pyrophosphatase
VTRPESKLASVAAIDLGSNSFHMVVARLDHGELQVVDHVRERVALAEGLDEQRNLTPEAWGRALECLSRFGQRLRDMPRGAVRAVGTNTLRRARNARPFLAAAQKALGYRIEVIPGVEEARLIYLGVAHHHADEAPRRLVIDIGGGSTECILGEGFDPLATDSLRMGCVGYSRTYFPGGALSRESMHAARVAAGIELQSIERAYRSAGWDCCIGSSGTILAVDAILRENALSTEGITPRALRKLRKTLIEAGHVEKLQLAGLQEDRKPVLAGGVAILSAVFDGLGIERMEASNGALREGLLYDLLGRIRQEDVRDRTIRNFSQRYHVDLEQARRVELTARALLSQVARAWDLGDSQAARTLSWAARLHEIGLSISYAGHHKHGAYIAQHADMPGFSRRDQECLAALITNHRRKPHLEAFESLSDPATAEETKKLCAVLRLAVLLNRSRSPRSRPEPRLSAKGSGLTLRLPAPWLARHPLTRADLEAEAQRLAELGFTFELA